MRDDKKSEKPSNPKTIREIKEILQKILDQYIDIESELSINISARTRANILKYEYLLLEQQTPICDINLSAGSTPTDDAMDDVEMERVETDEYKDHVTSLNTKSSTLMREFEICEFFKKMDNAIEEVIQLLTNDSLIRFYDSEEYQQMVRNKKVKDEGSDKQNKDKKERTKSFHD